VGSEAARVVGQPNSTNDRGESHVTGNGGCEWSGEGGWQGWSEGEEGKMRKLNDEEQFLE